MTIRMCLIASGIVAMAAIGLHCKQSTTEPSTVPPPPQTHGMTASPGSVRILPGNNSIVSVGGGSKPDTIVTNPSPGVATASIADTLVTIHGVGVGSTSMRVADHSVPEKYVDIAITVATSAVAIQITAPAR